MTDFIDETKEKRKGNKTVFDALLMGDIYEVNKQCTYKPSDFDYVKLIRKGNKVYNYDLMVGYNIEGNNDEIWFLGQWNDGC